MWKILKLVLAVAFAVGLFIMENSPNSVRDSVCAWIPAGDCPAWFKSNLLIAGLHLTLWALLAALVIPPVVGALVRNYHRTVTSLSVGSNGLIADAAATAETSEISKELWIPVGEALRWVVDNSDWSEDRSSDSHFWPAAVDLRQRARSGGIAIEGRKEIHRSFPSGRFSQVWDPIPPDYWSTHQFDLTVVLDGTARGQPETEVEAAGDPSAESMPHYTSLRVEQGQLHQEWPQKSVKEGAEAVAGINQGVGRDLSVLEAVHFLAFGSWEIRDWDELDGKVMPIYSAANDIEQAALDNAIPIWGKRDFSGKYFLIPASDWGRYKIKDTSLLLNDPEKVYARRSDRKALPAQYSALMTNKEKVEAWHAANT